MLSWILFIAYLKGECKIMKLKEITNKNLDEKYFYMKHPSGLNIYLYPKHGYTSSYAILGVNYGSIDAKFKTKSKGMVEVPSGIAHYLEHKLFESEKGDAFEAYAKTGASANAYTSFDKTAYLFSCSDKFQESLEILLNFVQSPYFTEKTVEKERGIIAQEIKMYDDNPDWRVYFNLLGAMYKNHPVRLDIAGTTESIAMITPEYLYECYGAFYNLNNMTLSISGNIDIDETMATIDKNLKYSKPFDTERILPEEPMEIVQDEITQNLDIGSPIFQLGFKESPENFKASEKDLACISVILKTLTSKASNMYDRLLNLGLINTSSFDCEYMEAPGMSAVIFGGESRDPYRTAQIIREEIEKVHTNGITEETFNWARKSLYGENIAGLNNISGLANSLLNASLANREIFKYINSLCEITLDDINSKIRDVLNVEYSALSVVKPK